MQVKKLWKFFIFLFLATFIIFNWNEVSWIFNYKTYKSAADILYDSSQDILAQSGVHTEKSGEPSEIKESEYSDKENSIEISKIEVAVPLVLPANANKDELYKLLDKGAVHFPSSALPGEQGQTIILGHSSAPNWPKIKYYWIFSRLNELTEGDEIFIYYNHRKYSYKVTKTIFVDRGAELPKDLTNSENSLILISCWPPGKDLKRIVVVAK
mgnify:CR=1 FL=1